jgi:tRNA-intron endonuclease, archaea type
LNSESPSVVSEVPEPSPALPASLPPPKIASDKDDAKSKKKALSCTFSEDNVVTEPTDEARELYNQSRFGSLLENGSVQLSLLEALYLVERSRVIVHNKKRQEIPFGKLLAKAKRTQKGAWVRYCVFRDMRNRGYIVKTALKFGADFRVYDRGVKPGEDHAKWVVFPVHETEGHTWYEFSAKNRVAHSTKKRLLIGVVDEESEVTYWEVRWLRP